MVVAHALVDVPVADAFFEQIGMYWDDTLTLTESPFSQNESASKSLATNSITKRASSRFGTLCTLRLIWLGSAQLRPGHSCMTTSSCSGLWLLEAIDAGSTECPSGTCLPLTSSALSPPPRRKAIVYAAMDRQRECLGLHQSCKA